LLEKINRIENLQMACSVNYRNIPGYCCQRSTFCDFFRNVGYFLCGAERVKLFSKIHPKNDQQNVDAAPPVEKFLQTTMNIGTSLRENGTLLKL